MFKPCAKCCSSSSVDTSPAERIVDWITVRWAGLSLAIDRQCVVSSLAHQLELKAGD